MPSPVQISDPMARALGVIGDHWTLARVRQPAPDGFVKAIGGSSHHTVDHCIRQISRKAGRPTRDGEGEEENLRQD